MDFVTLTTDWGYTDIYSGVVKAGILSLCPDTRIVDISHSIQPHNISQAAYLLKNSYRHFPENTVHIIGVQSEQYKNRGFLVVKHDNHYFISTDNGVFGLLFELQPGIIVQVDKKKYVNKSSTFNELNIFVPVTCEIIRQKSITELGVKTQDYLVTSPVKPVLEGNRLFGIIVHFDSYQNAITNIKEEYFVEICNERKFTIYVSSNYYKIKKISTSYHDSPGGELVAVFNSTGHLEIAICDGQVKSLLNLKINSKIRIDFE
jgi:S-adenosyl-L-methionine hydrolase (adenosine-forming)